MKYAILICTFLISTCLSAQENLPNSTITVTAQSTTKELAVTEALRTALEQTYGAFVSSSTLALNDKIIKDEISSITNGSIQKYDILNEEKFKNGSYAVTIKAVVSVSNLVSFIKSKGYEIEVNGGLFAMNIKQKQLNETAELNAVYNLVAIIHENMQGAYDYQIINGEPVAIDNDNNKWEIPLMVNVIANENMESCQKYLYNSLSSISLTKEEADNYLKLGKNVYTFPVLNNKDSAVTMFLLRNESSQKMLELVLDQSEFYIRHYTINNGIKNYNGVGDAAIYDNIVKGKDYYYYYFLDKGDTAALINYNDKLTLNEFEKLNKYSIQPNNIKVHIKNGGMIFYEDSVKGYVVNLFDIGSYSLQGAKEACKKLNLFGYTDWQLPNKEDIALLYNNLEKNKLGGFLQRGVQIQSTNPQIQPSALDLYWSSYDPTKKPDPAKLSPGSNWDAASYWFNPEAIKKVRAIRRYSVNGDKLNMDESDEAVTPPSLVNLDEHIGVFEFDKKYDFKIIITNQENKYVFVLKQNKPNLTTNEIVQEQMDLRTIGYKYYTRNAINYKMKELEKDAYNIIDEDDSVFAKKARVNFNRNAEGKIISITYTSKNGDSFTSIRTITLNN